MPLVPGVKIYPASLESDVLGLNKTNRRGNNRPVQPEMQGKAWVNK